MGWRKVEESVPFNNETVNFYVETDDGKRYVTSGIYTNDPVVTHAVLEKDGSLSKLRIYLA